MNSVRITAALAATAFAAAALAGGLPPAGATAAERSVEDASGFVALEPYDVVLRNDGRAMRLRTSPARVWFTLQAADEAAEDRPLFVFTNGGPGASTTAGLFVDNTARMTVDPALTGTTGVAPNPVSWTRLGNLLYVDARMTGFSYNLTSDPASQRQRDGEYTARNFTPFTDADDVIRVLLAMYEAQPALRDNPVVLVGESYGGERMTDVLHMMLNYRSYGDGSQPFQDRELARAIGGHFGLVFPDTPPEQLTPQRLARQFGHQILIQPQLSDGYYTTIAGRLLERPGSIAYRVSRQTGWPYLTCAEHLQLDMTTCDPYANALSFVSAIAARDTYQYDAPVGSQDAQRARAGELLTSSPDTLSTLTGVDVTAIAGLHADQRAQAVRVRDAGFTAQENPGAAWSAAFGGLNPWDRTYINWNAYVYVAFAFNDAVLQGYPVTIAGNDTGTRMLQNVLVTRTFLTGAALDLQVFSPAMPPTLRAHRELVRSLVVDRAGDEARPGRLVVTYRANDELGSQAGDVRTIRHPRYENAGHAVSRGEPVALFDDVRDWLGE